MTDIPENAKLARQRYEEGALTRDILAETGPGLWALYYWLAGGPKKNGVRALPAIAKRKLVTRRRLLKEERLHMVERMMRAAERQMREIEIRLAGSGQEPGASDRDARCMNRKRGRRRSRNSRSWNTMTTTTESPPAYRFARPTPHVYEYLA
jgi:hypothetical protein